LFTVGASPFYSTKTGLRVAKVTVFHPDFRECVIPPHTMAVNRTRRILAKNHS
jgi:hypothetical protein